MLKTRTNTLQILLEAARTMLTEFHAWVDCYHTAAYVLCYTRMA